MAASFTIAKMWKRPKGPSTDEWTNKMIYINTKDCTDLKSKEMLPQATAWMKLEDIVLSQKGQS